MHVRYSPVWVLFLPLSSSFLLVLAPARSPAVAEGPVRRCPNPRGHQAQARQAVERQLRALEAAAREKREGEAREATVEVAGRSFRSRVGQQRLAPLLPARLRRRLSRVSLHQRLDN